MITHSHLDRIIFIFIFIHTISHTDTYSLTVAHRHTHSITSTQVNTHLVTHRHNHIHSQKRTHRSPCPNTSMFTYSLTHTCSYIHLYLYIKNMHIYICIYLYIYKHAHAFNDRLFSHLLKHKCTKTQVQSIHSLTFMKVHDMLTYSFKHRNMITCIYSVIYTQTWTCSHIHSEPDHKLTSALVKAVVYMHMISIHTYIQALTQK